MGSRRCSPTDERYVPCATNRSKGYTNEWEELKTDSTNAKERTTPPQVQVVKVRMSTKSVAYGCFCLWRVALVSGEVKKRREAGPPWVGTGGLLGLFGHLGLPGMTSGPSGPMKGGRWGLTAASILQGLQGCTLHKHNNIGFYF